MQQCVLDTLRIILFMRTTLISVYTVAPAKAKLFKIMSVIVFRISGFSFLKVLHL